MIRLHGFCHYIWEIRELETPWHPENDGAGSGGSTLAVLQEKTRGICTSVMGRVRSLQEEQPLVVRVPRYSIRWLHFPNKKSDCGLSSSSHFRHSKSVLAANGPKLMQFCSTYMDIYRGGIRHLSKQRQGKLSKAWTWLVQDKNKISSSQNIFFFLPFSTSSYDSLSNSLYIILCVFCQFADYIHPFSDYCVCTLIWHDGLWLLSFYFSCLLSLAGSESENVHGVKH